MTTLKTLVPPQKSALESDLLLGGFLNIDKPAGWTSHDVVAKIRRALKMKRVGHLGTLDPQATGVLPICFGKGTKLSALLSSEDKEYEAVLRLGEETDTEDATGKVIHSTPVPEALQQASGRSTIEEALSSFLGNYLQKPPMYSAIKIKGVPLYKKARAGEIVDRPSRKVVIREISFSGMHGRDIAFRVACSKGTYIRTLCADLGKKLGVGGHLLSLRRTRSGCFFLDDAVELEAFISQARERPFSEWVYPLQAALSSLPALSVKSEYTSKVLHGVQVGIEGLLRWDAFQKGDSLRILEPEGGLLAIGIALSDSVASDEDASGFRRGAYKIKTVLKTVKS